MDRIEVLEYVHSGGRSPFSSWFERLNAPAAARVTVAVTRLRLGNFSNVQGVGAGVFEVRIDFGPGYRVYFGKDGPQIVVLLGGSSKARQSNAIALACRAWEDFKDRKG